MTRAELQRLADEDLMPLVAREDPLAFEVFYDRHAGAAYSLAYRIVGSRTAAEDVTQEALLSIWRSGARYDRARGSVRAWTLGIVRNRAIDMLRKESGRSPKLAAGGDELLERHAGGGAHRHRGRAQARRRGRSAARSRSCPRTSPG